MPNDTISFKRYEVKAKGATKDEGRANMRTDRPQDVRDFLHMYEPRGFAIEIVGVAHDNFRYVLTPRDFTDPPAT